MSLRTLISAIGIFPFKFGSNDKFFNWKMKSEKEIAGTLTSIASKVESSALIAFMSTLGVGIFPSGNCRVMESISGTEAKKGK